MSTPSMATSEAKASDDFALTSIGKSLHISRPPIASLSKGASRRDDPGVDDKAGPLRSLENEVVPPRVM